MQPTGQIIPILLMLFGAIPPVSVRAGEYRIPEGSSIISGSAAFSQSGRYVYESMDETFRQRLGLTMRVGSLAHPNVLIEATAALSRDHIGKKYLAGLGMGPGLRLVGANKIPDTGIEYAYLPYIGASALFTLMSSNYEALIPKTPIKNPEDSVFLLGFRLSAQAGILLIPFNETGIFAEIGYYTDHMRSDSNKGYLREDRILASIGLAAIRPPKPRDDPRGSLLLP